MDIAELGTFPATVEVLSLRSDSKNKLFVFCFCLFCGVGWGGISYFILETKSYNIYKHKPFYNTHVHVYGSHAIKYEYLDITLLWLKHLKIFSQYICIHSDKKTNKPKLSLQFYRYFSAYCIDQWEKEILNNSETNFYNGREKHFLVKLVKKVSLDYIPTVVTVNVLII